MMCLKDPRDPPTRSLRCSGSPPPPGLPKTAAAPIGAAFRRAGGGDSPPVLGPVGTSRCGQARLDSGPAMSGVASCGVKGGLPPHAESVPDGSRHGPCDWGLRPPGVLGALRPGQSLFSRAQGDTVSEDKVCLRIRGWTDLRANNARGGCWGLSPGLGGGIAKPRAAFPLPLCQHHTRALGPLVWIGFIQAGASRGRTLTHTFSLHWPSIKLRTQFTRWNCLSFNPPLATTQLPSGDSHLPLGARRSGGGWRQTRRGPKVAAPLNYPGAASGLCRGGACPTAARSSARGFPGSTKPGRSEGFSPEKGTVWARFERVRPIRGTSGPPRSRSRGPPGSRWNRIQPPRGPRFPVLPARGGVRLRCTRSLTRAN